MTPKQRYLFDINGYLHIRQVLNAEELAAAQAAVDRYISTPEEELPEGFSRSEDGKYYANGFAFDKALEALVVHPGIWPIIKEFTHDCPAFSRGTLIVDTHQHEPFGLHCAREDYGWQSTLLIPGKVASSATISSFSPTLTMCSLATEDY